MAFHLSSSPTIHPFRLPLFSSSTVFVFLFVPFSKFLMYFISSFFVISLFSFLSASFFHLHMHTSLSFSSIQCLSHIHIHLPQLYPFPFRFLPILSSPLVISATSLPHLWSPCTFMPSLSNLSISFFPSDHIWSPHTSTPPHSHTHMHTYTCPPPPLLCRGGVQSNWSGSRRAWTKSTRTWLRPRRTSTTWANAVASAPVRSMCVWRCVNDVMAHHSKTHTQRDGWMGAG